MTTATLPPQLTFDDIAPSPPPIGKLAGYSLGASVAPGVWLARRSDEEAPRAIARIFDPNMVNRRTLERFAHDAAQLRHIDHPGLAKIHAAGIVGLSSGPAPYLIEERVSGETIFRSAEKSGLRGRMYLLASLAEALHAAHLRGVCHRDLKASRVLVDDAGRVRVRGLGVAHITNDDVRAFSASSGATGSRVGHLAPEQAVGSFPAIDPRSDVYALGVIGYRLLTGRSPYELPGSARSAGAVIKAEAPAPMDLGSEGLARDAEAIIMRSLRKRPEARHQSASELAGDLTRALAGETHGSREAGARQHLRLAARRRPGLAAGAMAAVLALATGAGFLGSALTARPGAVDERLLVREPAPTATLVAQTVPELTSRMRTADRLSRARALAEAGHVKQAEALLKRMIDESAGARERVAAQRELAEMLSQAGREADAEPVALEALTRAVEELGPDSDAARACFRTLSRVLAATGRRGQEHQWWSLLAGVPTPPRL